MTERKKENLFLTIKYLMKVEGMTELEHHHLAATIVRRTICFLFFGFFFRLFAISWAAPMAYGGSQARGLIGAVATGLRQSHSNGGWGIRAASATYTTAHGNVRSLTH